MPFIKKGVEFLVNTFSASIELSNVDFNCRSTGVLFVFYKIFLAAENLKSEKLESRRHMLEFPVERSET